MCLIQAAEPEFMKIKDAITEWQNMFTVARNLNLSCSNLRNSIDSRLIKCIKIKRGKTIYKYVNILEVQEKINTIRKMDKFYIRTVKLITKKSGSKGRNVRKKAGRNISTAYRTPL